MSLQDPTKKMSKSDISDYSRINLTDDAETIALKIKKAKSDMVEGMEQELDSRPEALNLLTIYAALAGTKRDAVAKEYASANFSTFKQALADLAIEQLAPITALMRELMKDQSYIDGILREGAQKANDIASDTIRSVKEMVGFLQV